MRQPLPLYLAGPRRRSVAACAVVFATSLLLVACGRNVSVPGRTTIPTSLTPRATQVGGAAFVEYAIPAGDGYPVSIVVGPDGNLWVTQHLPPDDNSDTPYVGRLTPSGTLTEYPFASHGEAHNPDGLTIGPDKNLWFTESGSGTIGRVTVAGVVTEFALSNVNARPSAIAAGPDGALWFTESNANQIGRASVTGVITEYPIPTQAAFASGITAGPDGALWFTENVGNKIGRITTKGVITEFALSQASSAASAITAGPDGNLWFTETTG
ncbi:MAG TPA: hypothetical protein VF120_05160, partial [Ktedonobacterales bacterium]